MKRKILALGLLSLFLLGAPGLRKRSGEYDGERMKQAGDWISQRVFPGSAMPQKGFYQAWERFRQNAAEFHEEGNTPAPWASIGPINQGGRTNALAVDPQNPNVIYAGSASGGLWRLTLQDEDADEYTWEYIDTGYPVLGVNAIVVDPRDSNVLYIGTGEVYAYHLSIGSIHYRYFRGSYGIGILKSTDRGVSWTKSLDWSYDQRNGVLVMKHHPRNPDTLFAGTSEGLFKSTDAGATWNRTSPVFMAVDLVIFKESPDTMLLSCGNFGTADFGIYKSTDCGENWVRLRRGIPNQWSGKTMLSVCDAAPGMVIASIADLDEQVALCRSTNYGDDWVTISTYDMASYQGWYSHYVRPNPVNSQEIFWAGVLYGLSTNGGASFNVDEESGYEFIEDDRFLHPDHHAYADHPTDPDIFYVGHDGGVGRTTNGGRWFQDLSRGYVTTQFYPGFSCSLADSNLAAGGLQDNGTVIYRGNPEWQTWAYLGDGAYTALDPTDTETVYASSQYLNMKKSYDGGRDLYSWVSISPIANRIHADEAMAFVAPYVLATKELLYSATNYIYRSTNAGFTWSTTNGGSPLNGDVVSALAVSRNKTSNLFAATAPQILDDGTVEVFASTNSGNQWKNITRNLPNRYVVDLVVSPYNPQEVYAVLSGFGSSHFFRTTVDAGSWEDLGEGLPDVPSNACLIDPVDYQTMYVGNDLGVWVTRDDGVTWSSFNEGLPPAVIVYDLTLSELNNKIRMATHGNGVYERALIPTTENEDPVPQRVDLHQNYPNPFNEQTAISFTLPVMDNVKIEIFDVRGRRVRTWESQPYPRGTSEVIWDGRDENGKTVASGVYLYTVSIGKTREVMRMALIR